MNMIIKKEAATLERTSANEGVQLQSLTLSEGTIRFEPDVKIGRASCRERV